ncbi:MAG TPA: cell division protein ZapA [Gammaproteobacteria bacterium]|nr:cell division protein ZapA [Gammaproteobacteria bacterium]
MSTPKPVSVTILGEEYLISCLPEEESALQDSARLLDQRMREIRASGKVMNGERIAVMAGLNLSNELLRQQQQATSKSGKIDEHLRSLRHKIETALNP